MSVTIEKNGKIWTVVLHRPEVRNAVDQPTRELLQNAFEEFEDNRYLISVKGINRFLINHEKLHVNGYKVGTVSFKNFISDSTNSHNEATFAFKKDFIITREI